MGIRGQASRGQGYRLRMAGALAQGQGRCDDAGRIMRLSRAAGDAYPPPPGTLQGRVSGAALRPMTSSAISGIKHIEDRPTGPAREKPADALSAYSRR